MIKHQPLSELGFLDFITTCGFLYTLIQALGQQTRLPAGRAVCDPSAVTAVTPEEVEAPHSLSGEGHLAEH